jgi:arylsulfatase A-like enzyme
MRKVKNILILFLTVLFCNTIFAQKQKMNIVMIAIDDLNDWVGAYGGHPQAITPNIDKLAAKGMLFRNASCSGPVCGPSRSALLSGYIAPRTGAYGNANYMLNSKLIQENPTLPEYFSKHGYLTISRGKIYHGAGDWAFDVWEKAISRAKRNEDKLYSREEGIINGKKIENPKYTKRQGGVFQFGPTLDDDETTKDYMTAKWFEEKLQDDYDKPFFMAVGFSKPHLPFHAPQKYFDMYGLDTLVTPEYRLDDLDDIVDTKGKKLFGPHIDFLWCEEYGLHKEATQAYLAAVSYADACVGVVLDALENSEYAENTIVMLWGDHGWHLGEKLKYRKASLWRESTQNPFMVYVPGMTNGEDCSRNVNLQDIYPTLVDLCDLPEKEDLDGLSIKPLLQNPQKKWVPAVTTLNKGNHSVITEKWHYITHGKRNAEELYDLENDPMEWTNLAYKDTKEVREIKRELKAYLKSYLPEAEVEPVSGEKQGNTKENRAETIVW